MKHYYKGAKFGDADFNEKAVSLLKEVNIVDMKDEQALTSWLKNFALAYKKGCDHLGVKPELIWLLPTNNESEAIYDDEDEIFGCYRVLSNRLYVNLKGQHLIVTVLHELRHAWQAKEYGYIEPSDEFENDAEQFASEKAKEWFGIEYEAKLRNVVPQDYTYIQHSTAGSWIVQKSGNWISYWDLNGNILQAARCY